MRGMDEEELACKFLSYAEIGVLLSLSDHGRPCGRDCGGAGPPGRNQPDQVTCGKDSILGPEAAREQVGDARSVTKREQPGVDGCSYPNRAELQAGA